jgi:OOP family OmpA-OmpF porin
VHVNRFSILVAILAVSFAATALADDAPLEFKANDGAPGRSQGVSASRITPTKTEAALKFTVVDKDKGPIPGIVVTLTDPQGKKYYTEETDAEGYAEVLVPVAKTYEVVYLSLGRKDIAASLPVSDAPKQTVRLTLRYKRYVAIKETKQGFRLDGVEFDTGKAKIRPDSLSRLDDVIEYMTHKKSARVEISGHTDNVGNPKGNKKLSQARADSCRQYVMSKGIDASRVVAVGYGDEKPVASNDTEAGRQANRRIEATELAP